MRNLSEIKFKDKLAHCYGCGETFCDDMLVVPAMFCPNGCNYYLTRNWKEEDAVEVEAQLKALS